MALLIWYHGRTYDYGGVCETCAYVYVCQAIMSKNAAVTSLRTKQQNGKWKCKRDRQFPWHRRNFAFYLKTTQKQFEFETREKRATLLFFQSSFKFMHLHICNIICTAFNEHKFHFLNRSRTLHTCRIYQYTSSISMYRWMCAVSTRTFSSFLLWSSLFLFFFSNHR